MHPHCGHCANLHLHPAIGSGSSRQRGAAAATTEAAAAAAATTAVQPAPSAPPSAQPTCTVTTVPSSNSKLLNSTAWPHLSPAGSITLKKRAPCSSTQGSSRRHARSLLAGRGSSSSSSSIRRQVRKRRLNPKRLCALTLGWAQPTSAAPPKGIPQAQQANLALIRKRLPFRERRQPCWEGHRVGWLGGCEAGASSGCRGLSQRC